MIPGLFLITIMALALNVQFIKASGSGLQAGSGSGLSMNCQEPRFHRDFSASCVVNVRKLVKQGCYQDDHIFIMENTTGRTDNVTACHISRHTGQCLESPLCLHCGHSNGQTTIHFHFSLLGDRKVSCRAFCPNNRTLTSNPCWLKQPMPAYATFRSLNEDTNFAVKTYCPWDIPQLPFTVYCLANVTKLRQVNCLQVHVVVENTYDRNYCMIDKYSRTCMSPCAYCMAEGAHLVRVGFNISQRSGNLAFGCLAACLTSNLQSDTKCQIRYT